MPLQSSDPSSVGLIYEVRREREKERCLSLSPSRSSPYLTPLFVMPCMDFSLSPLNVDIFDVLVVSILHTKAPKKSCTEFIVAMFYGRNVLKCLRIPPAVQGGACERESKRERERERANPLGMCWAWKRSFPSPYHRRKRRGKKFQWIPHTLSHSSLSNSLKHLNKVLLSKQGSFLWIGLSLVCKRFKSISMNPKIVSGTSASFPPSPSHSRRTRAWGSQRARRRLQQWRRRKRRWRLRPPTILKRKKRRGNALQQFFVQNGLPFLSSKLLVLSTFSKKKKTLWPYNNLPIPFVISRWPRWRRSRGSPSSRLPP